MASAIEVSDHRDLLIDELVWALDHLGTPESLTIISRARRHVAMWHEQRSHRRSDRWPFDRNHRVTVIR